MRKFYFYFLSLLFCCFVTTSSLVAQEVQWAAEVIDFSTQYGDKDYSAKQVLGVPNATGGLNLHDMAWVPKRENSPSGEYVHVKFAKPMRIRQVAIAESLNPGSIHRIYLYGPTGKKDLIYENKNPQPVFAPFRMFRHRFPLTNYDVVSVRVELRTKAIEGSNQLDAIGISGSNTPIKIKVNQLSSEEIGQVERLGPSVNSEFAERLPMISPDGKTLYFARKYHPQNIGEENNDDIWVSYRQSDGRWSDAVNIGAPLNNRDHNFVAAFNPTGDILYLGSDYRNKTKDGVSVSYKKGRSWTTPKTLDIQNHYNNSEFVCYHMSLNEQILLMSVERDDGKGGLDLYASFRQKGDQFSEPINLGPQINTVGGESSIFLAADGKTIYFSSNGHEGFGGYDMFMSRRLDNSWQNWSTPKNLGTKVNTAKNEYNYTIPASGDYAYFSSGSPDGMSNLYRIPLPEEIQPEPVMLITGRLINAETNKPIKAQLKLDQFKNSTPTNSNTISSNGAYQLVVPYGEDLGLYAETDGYFAVSESLSLSGEELEELDYDREGMLAQTDDSASAYTTNGDIEQLQLRLSELDEDMEKLTVERERAKEVYRQQEKTQSSEYRRDPELEALRHKYNNTMRSKQETDQKQYGQKETEVSAPSSGDRELDELKRKFDAHYGDKTNAPEVATTPKQKDNKEPDSELEKMRRKYQKHYDVEQGSTSSETEVAVNETPIANIEEPMSSPDFELLENSVRQDLQATLFPKIYQELRQSMLPRELRSIERRLTTDEQEQLEQPRFVPQLKKQIIAAPIPEIKYRKNPILEEVEYEDIVKDLRKTLDEDVRSDLKKELADQVRNEIQNTLSYEIKRATEQRVRKELNQKMQEQIQAEKNRHEQINQGKEIVAIEEEETPPLKKEYQEVEKDILLVPIKVGQIIPMNNLFFDSNQASLKEASTVELQRVLRFLEKNPNLVVEIGGHTNGWCSHVFANELSWERAQAVVDYFTQQGIPASHLKHRGYGKTKAIATNETKAGRKKNQRVELKILEILD